MPIYRQDPTGKFMPFEAGRPDLERHLEDWIEQNPQLLLEGQLLAITGRQTNTSFGKTLDLLAVDETGASVVIELKRGAPPREIIAQALEYTAWIDSLSLDDLDAVAREYARRHQGEDVDSVADLYDAAFGGEGGDIADSSEEAENDQPSANVTFNARQRIVIVAESFPGEMQQTLRYLRGRLGVDVSAIRFQVHKLGNETLLETEIVVGREETGVTKTATGGRPTYSHDEIREKVSTPFLGDQVDGLEVWIEGLISGLVVQHNQGTHHSIYLNGTHLGGYYFAINWIRFWLNGRVEGDEEDLQSLGMRSSIQVKNHRIVGSITTEGDLAVYKRQLERRVFGSAHEGRSG